MDCDHPVVTCKGRHSRYHWSNVRFRAILNSSDAGAVQVLTRVLRDLGIDSEHHLDPDVVSKLLEKRSFDALIVDADDGPATLSLLEKVKENGASRRALGIAISKVKTIGNPPTGAHIVLYKPISVERVVHGLRAIKNLMARDRRSGAIRVPVEVLASIQSERTGTVEVTLVDVSEGGAAIRCEQALPMSGLLSIECQLPQTSSLIKAVGEVVWRDAKNQFGLRFVNISNGSRASLVSWLKENEHLVRLSYRGRSAGN